MCEFVCTSWTFCSRGNDPCRRSCKSDVHLDGTWEGTCRRVVVVSASMQVAVFGIGTGKKKENRKIMMYEQPNPGPNTKPHAGIIHVAPLFYSC